MSASFGLSATEAGAEAGLDDARLLESEPEAAEEAGEQWLGLVSLPTLCLQRLT